MKLKQKQAKVVGKRSHGPWAHSASLVLLTFQDQKTHQGQKERLKERNDRAQSGDPACCLLTGHSLLSTPPNHTHQVTEGACSCHESPSDLVLGREGGMHRDTLPRVSESESLRLTPSPFVLCHLVHWAKFCCLVVPEPKPNTQLSQHLRLLHQHLASLI
jgi:hypothetical protein